MVKNVSVETVAIPKIYKNDLDFLYHQYQQCLNLFYSQYSGIQSLLKIQNAKTLRNDIRRHMSQYNYNLADIFHFQGRHWVMALFQCCMNIKSNWSNLANRIKRKISKNRNLLEGEKHYIRYIVSSPQYWHCVLNHLPLKKNKKLEQFQIDDKRLHYIHNLICRLTRKYKWKIAHADNLTCMLLDENMYSIYEKDDKTYISISGLTKGKRMIFELKSPYRYDKKGDIQLIYHKDKNALQIHKCIKVKVKETQTLTPSIGIDKGYATLLSCSDNNEYGEQFGKALTKQAEVINQNTKVKNKLRDYHKKLSMELNETKDKLRRQKLITKLRHLEICNMGQKKFKKRHQKFRARTAQVINKNIKQMIAKSPAQIYAVEDLSFTNNMTPNKGKAFNRKMSFWTKGLLDERLEYISALHGIVVQKVNAAQTSKFCTICGAELTDRTGIHHEIAICPNCGDINANTNASKNINSRLYDNDITLYTPPAIVKEILRKRYIKNQQK